MAVCSSRFALICVVALALCVCSVAGRAESPASAIDSPFVRMSTDDDRSEGIARLQFRPSAYEAIREASQQSRQLVLRDFNLPQRRVDLQLQLIEVTSPGFRAEVVGPDGSRFVQPRVLTFRGSIRGESSYVFLAISPRHASGYVLQDAGRITFISSGDPKKHRGQLAVTDAAVLRALPNPDPWICGMEDGDAPLLPIPEMESDSDAGAAQVRIMDIFIDADHDFRALFDTAEDAIDYAVALLSAVSDIYRRDLAAPLRIPDGYLRLWEVVPPWGDLKELGPFMEYWRSVENPLHDLPRAAVHLITAPVFGGVAGAFGGMCSQEVGYGMSSVFGFFPCPVEHTHPDNWDLMVVAHELGHTSGSVHTFNYDPPIACEDASGPDEGTIMSYCHLYPGAMKQVGMRFHARVQQAIRSYLAAQTCQEVIDIQRGDYNFDSVLDESDLQAAEMCIGLAFEAGGCLEAFDMDGDGALSSCDYAILRALIGPPGHVHDCNVNGVADVCEDCNGNGVADECDIASLTSTDCNDNGVPDECESAWQGDCNGNGQPDFCDIVKGVSEDADSNGVPDECQQILVVPSADYPTIQSAIDDAAPGDLVVLEDGTYTGPGNRDLDFVGKILTVRSANGPENCIVDAGGQGRGFTFDSGETSASRIEGLTIRGGSASLGAGIKLKGSSPIVSNCVIDGNDATVAGGGIYCLDSDPLIKDCRISDNESPAGGGIYCSHGSAAFVRCLIEGNAAANGAGGFFVEPGTPLLLDCQFVSNDAIGNGGGIRLEASNAAVIRRCTISSNTAETGGGISASSSQPLIDNCVIAGNLADEGGGLALNLSSNTNVRNCTIVGNVSDMDEGHALRVYASGIVVRNTILLSDAPGFEIFSSTHSPVSILYSNVQGGEAAIEVAAPYHLIWGPGNLDLDPMFVDGASGDFHLSSMSPLIDAGDPQFMPHEGESDRDGNPRLVDGDGDLAPIVDIGAYEFQVTCIGDVDGDGLVNLTDLLLLLDAWGAGGGHPADLDGDGQVGSTDLFLLLVGWGACP